MDGGALATLLERRDLADIPNATLVERRDLTADVADLLVQPAQATPPFEPGQYATLGMSVDGRILQRPYSMAAPHRAGDPLEFHVRRVRGGALTERLWELPVGARVRLGAPRGRFVADPADRRAHLLVATGTGIAPFVAMIRDDLAAGRRRPIVVVHGVARADELGFGGLLAGLAADSRSAVRYFPTVSRPADSRSAGWAGLTGRAETLLAEDWGILGLDPARTVAYLCGNPGMVAAAEAALAARGLAPADVHRESYWLDRLPVEAA
jgi:ferredoxin--NADP+ reductase